MKKDWTGDQGIFTVIVPEPLVSQFRLLMKIAELRKQGVNVANVLVGSRESSGRKEAFVRQYVRSFET